MQQLGYSCKSPVHEMQSHFYFGLTGNQLFPGRIFNERDLRTSPHATAHFGYRRVNSGKYSFIEPKHHDYVRFQKAVHAMAGDTKSIESFGLGVVALRMVKSFFRRG
ncbi:MAG: hypothetical protein IPO33_18000 [Saprospiraceae bacterium]|nr:hypothetical protein [Candidatus Brachybacter algidus]